MQGVLREEEAQKHHYCSKSPDEGLNTTFYPNRPLTRKNTRCISHTRKEKHAWEPAIAHVVKPRFTYTFASHLQEERAGTEPRSVLAGGGTRIGCGAEPRRTPESSTGQCTKSRNQNVLLQAVNFRIRCPNRNSIVCGNICVSVFCIFSSITHCEHIKGRGGCFWRKMLLFLYFFFCFQVNKNIKHSNIKIFLLLLFYTTAVLTFP